MLCCVSQKLIVYVLPLAVAYGLGNPRLPWTWGTIRIVVFPVRRTLRRSVENPPVGDSAECVEIGPAHWRVYYPLCTTSKASVYDGFGPTAGRQRHIVKAGKAGSSRMKAVWLTWSP